MSLSPATRRMSPGSLVTTVIWPAGADWITAPRCASATETAVRLCMAAAVLAEAVSSGISAMRRWFGKAHAGEGPVPAGFDADCCWDNHLYCGCAALTACHDLDVAHNLAVLAMSGIGKGLDCLVIQDNEPGHAAGRARASAHSSTSSGLASGWFLAISAAAWRRRPGSAASGWPSSSAAAMARSPRSGRARGWCS